MDLSCHKCTTIITGDNVVGDGKFDSVKNKIYCIYCFFTKARIEETLQNSVSLMKFLKEGK